MSDSAPPLWSFDRSFEALCFFDPERERLAVYPKRVWEAVTGFSHAGMRALPAASKAFHDLIVANRQGLGV